MKSSNSPEKVKERPSELLRKIKRFKESRDNLKIKNREKASDIKKLSDRLTELEASRNHWREKSKQAARQCKVQEAELRRSIDDVNSLKAECDQLREEVESFKKKRSRFAW